MNAADFIRRHQLPRLQRVVLLALVALVSGSLAWGHGAGHKNLKLLAKVSHDDLEDGMADFAKGLGVKCVTCHLKNNYASDEKPAKVAARKFLAASLAEPAPARRSVALQELLKQMAIQTPKDEARIWKALERWQSAK